MVIAGQPECPGRTWTTPSSPPGLDLSPEQVARVAVALCGDRFGDVTGKVIHAAAGFVREYLLTRIDDSTLVGNVRDALERPDSA